MSKTTQIKRLYQSGTEFVPITLSEAVVVNPANIPLLNNEFTITTLDKVLAVTLGVVEETANTTAEVSNALNKAVEDINAALETKQDKLTAGEGIIIEPDENGNLIIRTDISFELFKIVDKLPEKPSAQYANTIYLVTSVNSAESIDSLEEYICVYKDKEWVWERLGIVRPETEVDLSGYVTKEEFNEKLGEIWAVIDSSITAEDFVTSTSKLPIMVAYTIPEDLYDAMVGADDGDEITTA